MNIQPNVTPKMPDISFGKKRVSAKLPNGLKIRPKHNPPSKALLATMTTVALLMSGTIIWRQSDYYKLQQRIKQLLKDVNEAETKRQDSININQADTISMADAVKLNEIG